MLLVTLGDLLAHAAAHTTTVNAELGGSRLPLLAILLRLMLLVGISSV
jgi:hypothetical protein